jgi:hypothetical protein
MKRALLVAVVVMTSSTASADPRVWIDDLLPLVDPPAPLAMQPKSDHRIDMLAATEHRHDHLWRVIDVTALAVSTAALACDWGQTHRAATEHWTGGSNGTGRHEANPIMGSAPSTRIVNVYFAATAALNVALWYALPKRYRSIVPVALTTVQAIQVSDNIGSVSLCGL